MYLGTRTVDGVNWNTRIVGSEKIVGFLFIINKFKRVAHYEIKTQLKSIKIGFSEVKKKPLCKKACIKNSIKKLIQWAFK